VQDGEWVEYDLTGAVTSDGSYTFVLVTDSRDGTSVYSRELPTSAPQLILSVDEAAVPTTVSHTPVPPESTATTMPSPTQTRVATKTVTPTGVPTNTPVTAPPTRTATAVPATGESAVVLAAGDIASCGSTGDEATAALLAVEAGTVITLGDNVYESGTAAEFANCYAPSWGLVKARTRPAVGNHEYRTAGAAPYYDYFGSAAGSPSGGYYSYDVGSWHVIVLNSNCSAVGGCGAGSPQEMWLRADLAANTTSCTMAYWHHPLFSSGQHGNNPSIKPLYQALYDGNAELILTGHDHTYERFAPQDPDGQADAARGVRQFVVGTGGKNHYAIGTIKPNSQVRNTDTFGVLKLVLSPTGYSWQFLPVAGKTFTDSGSGTCHDATGPVAQASGPLA